MALQLPTSLAGVVVTTLTTAWPACGAQNCFVCVSCPVDKLRAISLRHVILWKRKG